GDAGDEPGFETVCALGNLKNGLYQKYLNAGKIEVFEDARRFLTWVDEQGLKMAIVSSSKNCRTVVEKAGLSHYFSVRVDGTDLDRGQMAGKPAPDMFVAAAEGLGVAPQRAIVVEDAVAGVEAGRRGRFGRVIGVARDGGADALEAAGADLVIANFDELQTQTGGATMKKKSRDALASFDEIFGEISEATPAVFLDYDGTLTPIVEQPDQATLADSMRRAIERVAAVCDVAVVSGRNLNDVRERVGVDGIAYAGSHGFDILDADGEAVTLDVGDQTLPTLDAAEKRLREQLTDIEGAHLERKRYSLAIHYRQVDPGEVPTVEERVDSALEEYDDLRKTEGKKVFDLQPDVDWHKGRAVEWLLDSLELNTADVVPIYLGDDVTDEDAFETLAGRGVTIVVEPAGRRTAADYVLADTAAVEQFLNRLADTLDERT
ncbi:MAG: trehalose-phosphatase, partial [Persicimonas sp.]